MSAATSILPAHALRAARAIEIKTRQIVNSTFTGEYHSIFKGQGLSAAEVRPYQYGDDVRFIDWNVTAKTGSPYIKLFEEDREMSVVFMVDVSGSGFFGSGEQSKVDLAMELAAVLGFSAVNNQDRVGLLLFSDRVEQFIPPQRGRRHMFRLLRELYCCRPEGVGTSLDAAVTYFSRMVRRKTTVVILSDFFDDMAEKPIRYLASRHDVIPIVVEDVRESVLPAAGLLRLQDSETGEELIVNSDSADVRQRYENLVTARRIGFDRLLQSLGVRPVVLRTDESYVAPLRNYFEARLRFGRG